MVSKFFFWKRYVARFLTFLPLLMVLIFVAILYEEPSQTMSLHSFMYLHPIENSITTILSTVLKANNNYHSWSRSIIIALSEKNKVEFSDGTVPKLEKYNPSYHVWQLCNNMILCWLVHYVSILICRVYSG